MPIPVCAVTGNVKNLLNNAVTNCTITVSIVTPFYHTGSFISGEIASTTTDASGGFSLSVIETETVGQRVAFTFQYFDGTANFRNKKYTVVVPNTSTAELAALISSNSPPSITTTFPASQVTLTDITNLTATNVQAAVAELQAEIDALGSPITQLTGEVTATGPGSSVATIGAGVIVDAKISPTAAINATKIGDGSVDNASFQYVSGATSNIQDQLNTKISSGAALDPNTVLITDGSSDIISSAVSATELSYLTGVTSAIQTQIDGKVSGGPLTADRAVVSDGSGEAISATTTAIEIGYVNGVTSSIQTQLDAKQTTGNYITSLTGQVNGTGPGATATTLANNTVTVGQLAQIAATSVLGNSSGSTADVQAITTITDGQVLRRDSGALSFGAVPLATVGSVTGSLPIANGGTGANTATAGFNNLSPMTALGDTIYGGASGTRTRLAGNTTTTKQFLSQTGNGSVSAAPAWSSFTAPTVQKFTSGSGTYTTPAGVLYIRVVMVGGGGGGAGSGTAAGTAATAGGNTTFGTALHTAGGGSQGIYADYTGGVGGNFTLGSGASGTTFAGGRGGGGGRSVSLAGAPPVGGGGGTNPMGGGQPTGGQGTAGQNGATNSGAGGSGAGGTNSASTTIAGDGGGAGAYMNLIISSPSSSYAYAVGAQGTGGGAGTNGSVGGNGGSGYIIVEEYYQ